MSGATRQQMQAALRSTGRRHTAHIETRPARDRTTALGRSGISTIATSSTSVARPIVATHERARCSGNSILWPTSSATSIPAASYSSRVPGSSRPSRVLTRGHAPARASAAKQQSKQQPHSLASGTVDGAATTRTRDTTRTAAPLPPSSTRTNQQPRETTQTHSAQGASSSKRPSLDHATILVPRDASGTSVIDSSDALRQSVSSVLGQPTLVVTREIEMLNVFMGFEQANKYAIVTPDGQQVGYLAEQETGLLGGTLKRQFLRTHRPFEAHILDLQGRVIMSIKRGLTYINSRTQIFVVDPETAEQRLIGEVQQVWHPWRRKYELFVNQRTESGEDEMVQFASIDGQILTWDFVMTDETSRPLGAITRNFRGLGREMFTDTGQYVLSFDPTSSPDLRLEAPQNAGQDGQKSSSQGLAHSSTTGLELVQSGPARALGMDERAVALATAISADFDYFSRHSGHGHGGFFPFFWMGGGDTPASEPAAGEAGEAQVPSAQRQDSSDVQAPPSAPGSDGGLGPAVGTGIGYEMMGGGRQSSPSYGDELTPQQQQQPGPSADTGRPVPTQDPYGDEAVANENSNGMSDGGWGWGSSGSPPRGSGNDLGTGQEDVWGDDDPWGGSSPPSDGGGGGGWSIGDFFGGGSD